MRALVGIIIANKMNKTAVVQVTRSVVHPLYRKLLKKRKRYKVDTGEQSVGVGERVRISPTRPIAKDKHFRIVEIVNKKPVTTETQKKPETQKLSVAKKFSASMVARKVEK